MFSYPMQIGSCGPLARTQSNILLPNTYLFFVSSRIARMYNFKVRYLFLLYDIEKIVDSGTEH